jgi:hypothetical protein
MASAVRGQIACASSRVPPLSVRETGRGCRLSLGGVAVGHGRTLQEAADELVGRVLDAALALREEGISFTLALPPTGSWSSSSPRWRTSPRAGATFAARVLG